MKKTIKMITGMTLAGAIMFSTVTTVSASVTGSMDVAEEDYSSLVSTVDTVKEQYPAEEPKKNDTTPSTPATPAVPAAPSTPATPATPAVPATPSTDTSVKETVRTEVVYVPTYITAEKTVKNTVPTVTATSVKATKAFSVKLKAPHIKAYSSKNAVIVGLRGKAQKGVKGYEICVSYNKLFTDVTVVKTTGTSKKVYVAPGKRVYVRVRAYAKVNGKTVYSKWSTTTTAKATK